MRRNATLCSILIVALGASYMSWNNGDASGVDASINAPIFQANARDVTMITWESPSQSVVATRRSDAKGDYTWVTVTERPEPPEPDDGAPEGAPNEENDPAEAATDEAAPAPTVVSFVGNQTSERLWENVSPLRALRALPETDQVDKDVLAFEETATTLTLGKESGHVTLQIGGETYGSKDRFVLHVDQLFLVDDATFRPLISPKSQLVEHRLFPLSESDTERVEVRRAGQAVTYSQQNRDDRAQAFWAKSDNLETKDQGAGLWIGKLFRLRVKSYIGQPIEDAKPLFAFTVHGEADTWGVEILGHTVDGKETYYARSSLTRGLVELTRSLTADVVDDLDSILE